MTFETIDWPAEAKRVARAFGVGEACHFGAYRSEVDFIGKVGVEHSPTDRQHLTLKDGITNPNIFECSKTTLYCTYDHFSRTYWITCEEIYAAVSVDWDESVSTIIYNALLMPLLCKALFNLGLLTPELEEQLGVTASAHEKMEWATEYDERTRL